MKLGRIILAVIFLIFFLTAAIVAFDAMRSVSYDDVFPDNVNGVIWVHKPLDVPFKVLNSSAARNFFKTEMGKQLQKQIDENLAILSAPKKNAPKPSIYTKKIDGVNVYYPEIIKPAETVVEETVVTTPEAKPATGKMTLAKLQNLMGVGGAVVQDLYVGLYGNPMDAMMTGKPNFMFAMDLGRLSIWPRLVMGSQAKPLPANRIPGEDEALQIGFAFYRNMVIAGDAGGIERMIHTLKGTTMKVKVASPEGDLATTEAKIETLSFKPLRTSKVWQRLEASLNPKATMNMVLILPNLLNQLKTDPMMAESINSSAVKFGLGSILGLVHSNQMDEKGLALTTEIVFTLPNPIFTLLNQQEREMAWPKLLPGSFLYGAGVTVDNYPALWKSAGELFGDALSGVQKQIQDRFGIDDFNAFLGVLGKEISIVSLTGDSASATVHCDQVIPSAKDFFSKLEVKAAETAMAEANKAVEDAVTAGAETYAAEPIGKAKEAVGVAKTALDEGRRVEAVMVARKAKEFARAGMMTIANEADSYISAAMSAGAYTYAQEQLDAANNTLKEAKDDYDTGKPAAGTDAAKKALSLGKLALALGKAGTLIDEAKTAGADTKAAVPYAAAQTALTNAKTAFTAGNIDTAIVGADLAATQAKLALTTAGGTSSATEPTINPPPAIDYTLPTAQSPKVIAGAEVFQSVGSQPVDYTFLAADTMCYGPGADLETFLKTPRGDAVKSPKMMELMSIMPKDTQGLVLADIFKLLDTNGIIPSGEEAAVEETPGVTPEAKPAFNPAELKAFLSNQNLLLGAYMVSGTDSVKLAAITPVKLFDGSTSSGARSAVAVLFFLCKWLFYILGLVFLYLAIRMIGKKKVE